MEILLVILAALILPQVSEAKAKKAELALVENSEDPEAHLTLGKYLAFVKEDWEKAIPHLAKGSDDFFRELATKEVDRAADKLSIADAWWNGSVGIEARLLAGATATSKVDLKKEISYLRPKLRERALYWYALAWPTGPETRKPEILKLARAAAAPAGGASRASGSASGWGGFDLKKCGSSKDGTYAHSGRFSATVSCDVKASPNAARFMGPMIPIPAGTKSVTFSAWARSEGTEGRDALQVGFWTTGMEGITQGGPEIPGDMPFWTRVERTIQIPDRAAKMAIFLVSDSSKGAIWVDDISLIVSGRDLVENGGFEK